MCSHYFLRYFDSNRRTLYHRLLATSSIARWGRRPIATSLHGDVLMSAEFWCTQEIQATSGCCWQSLAEVIIGGCRPNAACELRSVSRFPFSLLLDHAKDGSTARIKVRANTVDDD